MAAVPQNVLDALSTAEDSIAAALKSDTDAAAAVAAAHAAQDAQTAAHQKSTADSAAALTAVKTLLGLETPAPVPTPSAV